MADFEPLRGDGWSVLVEDRVALDFERPMAVNVMGHAWFTHYADAETFLVLLQESFRQSTRYPELADRCRIVPTVATLAPRG